MANRHNSQWANDRCVMPISSYKKLTHVFALVYFMYVTALRHENRIAGWTGCIVFNTGMGSPGLKTLFFTLYLSSSSQAKGNKFRKPILAMLYCVCYPMPGIGKMLTM